MPDTPITSTIRCADICRALASASPIWPHHGSSEHVRTAAFVTVSDDARQLRRWHRPALRSLGYKQIFGPVAISGCRLQAGSAAAAIGDGDVGITRPALAPPDHENGAPGGADRHAARAAVVRRAV